MNKLNNNIFVNWRQLFGTIEGIESGKDNNIIIEREIIPIIFVPGIMGSKLKQTEPTLNEFGEEEYATVWDPDRINFTRKNHVSWKPNGEDLQKLKELMIGETEHDADFLSVLHEEDESGLSNLYSSYDALIETLQQFPGVKDSEACGHCFEYPVYGFGYNWTASNVDSGKKLKAYIEKTIDKYQRKQKRECNHVIIVSHSMGGLVTREACRLLSLEGEDSKKVLCVIHGAQPVHGAVTAYSQMKLGSGSVLQTAPGITPQKKSGLWDRIKNTVASLAIGYTGKAVTVKMARMPGALELLPTKQYKTDAGSKSWLHYQHPQTGQPVSLPQTNPYTEIYAQRGVIHSLIDEAWLEPWVKCSQSRKKNNRIIDNDEHSQAWNEYIENLERAEQFHDVLDGYVHPSTYQLCGEDLATVDQVVYERDKQTSLTEKKNGVHNFLHYEKIGPYEYQRTQLFLQLGNGDGTVTRRSATGLGGAKKTAKVGHAEVSNWNDVEHQNIYVSETVRYYVLEKIEGESHAKIRSECDVAQGTRAVKA